MSRIVLRPVLNVVGTIVLALLFLGLWQWFVGGDSIAAGFAEGVRVLFNFMDVGLAIWVVLLIVSTVRSRARGGESGGGTYLFLLIGAVLNAIVVLVVGFIQGGAGPWLVMFAIAAGIACLIAAAVVVPIVHRVLRS